MTNIDIKIDGNKLNITVDLDEAHGKSKTGKTEVIATTHGFVWASYKGKSVGYSINVIRK